MIENVIIRENLNKQGRWIKVWMTGLINETIQELLNEREIYAGRERAKKAKTEQLNERERESRERREEVKK